MPPVSCGISRGHERAPGGCPQRWGICRSVAGADHALHAVEPPARIGDGEPVIALDTLAYARRLRQAGFSEEQAEAQAEALAAVLIDSLAPKPDLQELDLRMDTRFARPDERFARIDERFRMFEERFESFERQMDTRFAEQTARFDAKLSDLERRLTMRIGGMMMAGIGAVSALVKLL